MANENGKAVDTKDKPVIDMDTGVQSALWDFEDKIRDKMPEHADLLIRHAAELAIGKRITAVDITKLTSDDGIKAIAAGQTAAKGVVSESDPKATAQHVTQFEETIKHLHIELKPADPALKPDDVQIEADAFMRTSDLAGGAKGGRALTGLAVALEAKNSGIDAEQAKEVLAVAENKLQNGQLTSGQLDALAGDQGVKALQDELEKNDGHVRLALTAALKDVAGHAAPHKKITRHATQDEASHSIPGNLHMAIAPHPQQRHAVHRKQLHGHGHDQHPVANETTKHAMLDKELHIALGEFNGAAMAANVKPLTGKQMAAIESRAQHESLAQERNELGHLEHVNEFVLGQERLVRTEKNHHNEDINGIAQGHMDGDEALATISKNQEHADKGKIKPDAGRLKSLIKEEDLTLLKGLSMQAVPGGHSINHSPNAAGAPDNSKEIKR